MATIWELCKNQRYSEMEDFLKQWPLASNARAAGTTILEYTVNRADLRATRILLDYNADSSENEYLAVQLAVRSSNHDLCVLFAKREELKFVDHQSVIAVAKARNLNLLNLLAESDVDLSDPSYLSAASESGDLHIIAFFLKHGRDDATFQAQVFKKAIELQNLEVFQALVNTQQTVHSPPWLLSEAVRAEATEIIRFLVLNGVDIQANKNEALVLALSARNLVIADFLAEHRADLSEAFQEMFTTNSALYTDEKAFALDFFVRYGVNVIEAQNPYFQDPRGQLLSRLRNLTPIHQYFLDLRIPKTSYRVIHEAMTASPAFENKLRKKAFRTAEEVLHDAERVARQESDDVPRGL